MARKPRKVSSTGFYHVIMRGNGKQLLFWNDEDRRKFLDLLANAFGGEGLSLIAWCLMDNHVHLCVDDEEEGSLGCLSAAMKSIGDAYAKWFNNRTGHVGHVFQGRFESLPVESEAYLLGVVRYIHQNPTRAKLCAPDEYPWSSYHEYVGGSGMCSTSLVLAALGGVEGFEEFTAQAPGPLPRELIAGSCRLSDADAIGIAASVLGGMEVQALGSLSKAECGRALRELHASGFPKAQIARLTGVGEMAVSRALNET